MTALGGAGGSTIISGVSFVAMKALWMKKDVKYAIDFPRLHNQLKPNVTTYEKRWPKVLKFGIYMDPHPGSITFRTIMVRTDFSYNCSVQLFFVRTFRCTKETRWDRLQFTCRACE